MNKLATYVLAIPTLIGLPLPAIAQTTPTITTIAGTGVPGDGVPVGDGGPATQANLSYLVGTIAADRWGNIYFSESHEIPSEFSGSVVRRVEALTGVITTVAGGGTITEPPDGTPANQARMNVSALAVDFDGNLFLGEYRAGGTLIRRVDALTGLLSTYAGGGATTQYHEIVYPYPTPHVIYTLPLPAGDGGPATSAYISDIWDMAFDAAGNLFFCDRFAVRRIDAQTGVVSTVAGNGLSETLFLSQQIGVTDSHVLGVYSGDGGPATSAGLEFPMALALDSAGNLFISDVDIVADYQSVSNLRIRRVDAQTGIITPYVGVGTRGFSGDGGPAALAEIDYYCTLAVDAADNLFVCDGWNGIVRKVDAGAGMISTLVGTPLTYGFSGDGGPAADALLNYPGGIAFDPAGNLSIVDYDNYRIRKVTGLNPDAPPTADAGPDQSIHAGTLVSLDGSASFDDNTPTPSLTYTWSFASRPAGSGASLADPAAAATNFTADLPGTYVLELVVEDSAGQASPPDQAVISSTNLAPAAAASADQVAVVFDPVVLDGSASSDPELDQLSYQWALVQAPAGSAAVLFTTTSITTAFVPDVPGDYLVALVVSDGFGPSSPDTVLVTAITGEQFVENTAKNAIEIVALSSVTTQGNQQAISSLLTQVIQFVQSDNLALARTKLEQAIIRTDGCALRGQPDAAGLGRDWITDCGAQLELYQGLTAALSAIAP